VVVKRQSAFGGLPQEADLPRVDLHYTTAYATNGPDCAKCAYSPHTLQIRIGSIGTLFLEKFIVTGRNALFYRSNLAAREQQHGDAWYSKNDTEQHLHPFMLRRVDRLCGSRKRLSTATGGRLLPGSLFTTRPRSGHPEIA
jgi:hypothetical protein